MNISVLFAAMGGAILVWLFLLRHLKAKPWTEQGPTEAGGAVNATPEQVGLWVFLAVVSSLFGLFAIVYNMRAAFPDWRPLPEPGLLWANTAVLILASVALQRARSAAAGQVLERTAGAAARQEIDRAAHTATGQHPERTRGAATGRRPERTRGSAAGRGMAARGNRPAAFERDQGGGLPDGVKPSLMAAGLLTVAFLVGQAAVWRQLASAGHYLSTNPADAFFYILTAAHGLHLLGGLWFWLRLVSVVRRGFGAHTAENASGDISKVRQTVTLCAIYWHYLLAVWLILFGLLLAT